MQFWTTKVMNGKILFGLRNNQWMWTVTTNLRYIKFTLCKFHPKMTIFPLFFHLQILKYIGTTCTRLIIWETYFGSTKLCCLTFRDPCIFIKLLMQNKLFWCKKKRGLIFSQNKPAGIILSVEGVFIAITTWANQQVQNVPDQWFSIIFCHSPPRRQTFFHALPELK